MIAADSSAFEVAKEVWSTLSTWSSIASRPFTHFERSCVDHTALSRSQTMSRPRLLQLMGCHRPPQHPRERLAPSLKDFVTAYQNLNT